MGLERRGSSSRVMSLSQTATPRRDVQRNQTPGLAVLVTSAYDLLRIGGSYDVQTRHMQEILKCARTSLR